MKLSSSPLLAVAVHVVSSTTLVEGAALTGQHNLLRSEDESPLLSCILGRLWVPGFRRKSRCAESLEQIPQSFEPFQLLRGALPNAWSAGTWRDPVMLPRTARPCAQKELVVTLVSAWALVSLLSASLDRKMSAGAKTKTRHAVSSPGPVRAQ